MFKKLIAVIALAGTLFAQTVQTPTLSRNNTWTGTETFNGAVTVNSTMNITNGFTAGASSFTGNISLGSNSLTAGAGTFSGQLQVANGSSTAPAIAFTSSPSTGMYQSTTGRLAFSNAGSVVNLFTSGGWTGSSAARLSWTNGTVDPLGTIDTGLSRASAGVVAVGTGAAGSTAGGLLSSQYNNRIMADTQTGATVDVKIAACLSAAVANGSYVCDARGITGNQTIAAQISVSTSGEWLLLPAVGVWSSTINDVTKCAIFQGSGTHIIGGNETGLGNFQINTTSGALRSVYCTDGAPAGGGSYVNLKGISFGDSAHVKTQAVVEIRNLFDGSKISDISAGGVSAPFTGKGLWVYNVCCGTTFERVVVDGIAASGAVPCTFGGVNNTAIYATDIRGISCVHPGNSQNAVVVESSATTSATNGLSIHGLYLEELATTPADTTTPYVQINGAQNLLIDNVVLGSQVDTGTRYVADIANVAGTGVILRGIESVAGSPGLINDHINGVTISGQNVMPEYVVGTPAYFQGQMRLSKGSASAPALTIGPEQMGYYWFSSHILGLTNPGGGAGFNEWLMNGTNHFWQYAQAVCLAWTGAGDANAGAASSICQPSANDFTFGNGGVNDKTASLEFGKVKTYGGVATVAGGIPVLVAKADLTAQAANVTNTIVYAVPASGAGFYRLSIYIVLTQAATTSSTLPSGTALWTDNDTSVATASAALTNTFTSNVVGLNSAAVGGAAGVGGSVILNAKASTNIQFSTSNYASSGATPMQYAVHVKLEYLGN